MRKLMAHIIRGSVFPYELIIHNFPVSLRILSLLCCAFYKYLYHRREHFKKTSHDFTAKRKVIITPTNKDESETQKFRNNVCKYKNNFFWFTWILMVLIETC